MRGVESGMARAPELQPRWERGRSLWKTSRRAWKEFAWGRPEDGLLLGLRREESTRAALEWLMLSLLALAPVVGLLMDPSSAVARILLLLVTAAGLLAATRLEGEPSRSALITPLSSALLGTGFATVLALGVLVWRGPLPESRLWIAYSFFPVLIGAGALRDDGRLPALTGILCAAAWLGITHATPALRSAAGVPIGAPALAAQLLILGVAGVLAAVAATRGRALRRSALLHPATGLMNRAAFEACLAREASRALRVGRPISVARIQLEAFAELVGSHGRPLADAVERYVSTALRDRCRSTDGVAHLADGSFAIAFLGSAHPRLQERLDGLCQLLRDFEVTGADDPAPLQLALRCGLAALPRDGKNVTEVLTASERRLASAVPSRPFGAATA